MIQVVRQDCEDMEAVEICWECGGNIKQENLIWYPDPDIHDAYLPGHAQCVDEDIQISDEEHTEILEKSLAPMLEEDECSCGLGCMGTQNCSICGPHDEDAFVGYDEEGRPIGG